MSDILLEWMSFREVGRRNDLPEKLCNGSPSRILNHLSALGHAEVQSDGDFWRIAPPVFAITESDETNSSRAVLCGARTPKLLEKIKTASARAGTKYCEISQTNSPSVIAIDGANQIAIETVAADVGVLIQRDAAFTLLACLPTIRDWPRKDCPMVDGRVEVERFSRSKLAWCKSSLEGIKQARHGFFRIRSNWQKRSHVLKLGLDNQAKIEPHAGRLVAAQGAKVVHWDAVSRCLRIPGILYPPALIARALVLCSGKLHTFDRDSREVFFHDVSARIMQMVLAITGLRRTR